MKPPFSLVVPLLALGCVLSVISEARAFGGAPGGPFSNGSYFPNEGTFSAVIRGENLSGVLQFSTTGGAGPVPEAGQDVDGSFQPYQTDPLAIGGLGSTGVATIYYDGDTFFGNSQGSYNPAVSTMSVNFQASMPGQGQQDVTTQTLEPLAFDVVNNNPEPTSYGYTITRRFLYFDSVYINGAAECTASDAFPNQKFAGSGEAEMQYLDFSTGQPILVPVRFPLSIAGVRLSNTASSFALRSVTPPSVNSLSVLQE